jgi:group I intron endonuclease
MVSGVYYIYCSSNKKGYVGSSYSITKRWHNHKSNLKNNKHPNIIIQNSYNKYGNDKFEYSVLAKCPIKYLSKLEQWFKDKSMLNSKFNIRQECESNRGIVHSQESKKKISDKAKGRKFENGVREKLSQLKKQKIKENDSFREKIMLNLVKNPIGERNPNAKLTNEMVIEIRDRIKKGERVCDLKHQYPCSLNMLYEVKNYKNWKNV